MFYNCVPRELLSLSSPIYKPCPILQEKKFKAMENRTKNTERLAITPPESDSDSPPNEITVPQSEYISISPPPGNSPDNSSIYSDQSPISHRSSPKHEILHSPDNPITHLPENTQLVVYRAVLEEPRAVVDRAVVEEPVASVTKKTDPGGGGEVRGRGRFLPSLSILKRGKREKMVKRAGLGFRVFGFLFCLVSLAVMAADRNQGWALDSFERYIEFRYCMAVNVLGFVYSGAQALDSSYNLVTGKYFVQHQVRYYVDFALDQMIAYLLISASSSAATRIDDWQSNWGNDKFPDMATASVSMTFLAFVAIASSSLISGYALCSSKSL